MKTIYAFLFSFGFLVSFSQTSIGMSKVYFITPATATNSNVGTYYDSTITVTCYIKNKGTATFNGNINIYKRVDTLNAPGTAVKIDSLVGATIAPNDSIQYVFADSITPQTYKVAGNGNTIVVWPLIIGNTADTLVTMPVYIHNINGIEELTIKKLLIYPNPTSQKLFIMPESGVLYDKWIIYDIQMKRIKEASFKEEIDISALPQGTYWINVTTKNKKIYTALFTKTE